MKRFHKYSMHAVVAMLFATVLISNVSYAVGPAIDAKVYDGQPAVLTISSLNDNETVSESPVLLKGAVHNISQIMLYIDSDYSMTHPLDDGAMMYAFYASVSPGPHVLKLIAINPYEGTTVEETISIIYTPGAEPIIPIKAVTTIAEGAVATKEYLQNQVDQASTTEPATFLSDVSYNVMNALDLVPTTGHQSMPQMATRFWTISSGVALIVLTHPMITLYHLIRYRFLEWNVNALPELVRHHAAFVLRVGGVLLLAVGFFM